MVFSLASSSWTRFGLTGTAPAPSAGAGRAPGTHRGRTAKSAAGGVGEGGIIAVNPDAARDRGPCATVRTVPPT